MNIRTDIKDALVKRFHKPMIIRSKTYQGLCENVGCTSERRHCSKYCQECSDHHKKQ